MQTTYLLVSARVLTRLFINFFQCSYRITIVDFIISRLVHTDNIVSTVSEFYKPMLAIFQYAFGFFRLNNVTAVYNF